MGPKILPGAAAHHLLRLDQPQQSLEVLLVDDLPVAGAVQGGGAELDSDLPDDLLQQGVLDALLAEEIVGGHTGLAAVEVFSKDDAPGGQL